MFATKKSHPNSVERSRNRRRLRSRSQPDYCYSDEQDAEVDVPDFDGPWRDFDENSVAFTGLRYYNPNTDALEELEEMVTSLEKNCGFN